MGDTLRTLRASVQEIDLIESAISDHLFSIVADAIQNSAKFRMSTSDGRTFLLFSGGESIRHHYEAEAGEFHPGLPRDCTDKQRLDDLAGMIAEQGSAEQPILIYGDGFDVQEAWLGLHWLHGEPLSAEEVEWFGTTNEELFEGDCSAT